LQQPYQYAQVKQHHQQQPLIPPNSPNSLISNLMKFGLIGAPNTASQLFQPQQNTTSQSKNSLGQVAFLELTVEDLET
jgi:hypothetical protein